MARQYWVQPLPPFHITDGAAIASTSLSEASPTPPVVIPANMLEIGTRLEIQAFGRYTSTATPGTIVMGVYIGTGGIASGHAAFVTAALTVQASQTNRSWRVEANASVRSVGATTAATILGLAEVSNITTNGTDLAPATAPATFAFDSTVANNVRLGITTSVATGSWTCHYFGVRWVN
jgi:hypothetical protein